ncbi:unnamed protein product [Aphis gossypii]|uniref:Uncharacterized protein n=1 Tax=Aphis gossypii TaxID=80765 RepID=A0A9P0J7H8_APHGO|nr:unnamed protein product [Aphis gossypii]
MICKLNVDNFNICNMYGVCSCSIPISRWYTKRLINNSHYFKFLYYSHKQTHKNKNIYRLSLKTSTVPILWCLRP